jgi:putative transposase
MFIDYLDISEPPFGAYEAGEQPAKDLAEYRCRLNRARRRAARDRLTQLVAVIDSSLPRLLIDVARDSQSRLGDNAAMESFFGLLPNNVLDRQIWSTRQQMRHAIVTWIERTYHRGRRQRSLSRLTPIEYETVMTPPASQAS